MTTPLASDFSYWLPESRARARVALRLKYRAEFEGNAKLAECYEILYKLWQIVERHILEYLDGQRLLGPELQDLPPPRPFENEGDSAQLRCIELYIRAASIHELYPCEDEPLGRVADLWWEAAWHYGWAALAWERGKREEAEEAECTARELADEAAQGEQANDFEFELPPSVRPVPPRPPAPADPGRLDLPPLPRNRT